MNETYTWIFIGLLCIWCIWIFSLIPSKKQPFSPKYNSVGEAHDKLVQYVNSGREITTEDGEKTKEIMNIKLEISTPMREPRISNNSFMKQRAMDEYTKNLLYGSTSTFEYDYHTRLFDGVNQIDYIVNKLKESSQSRRAIAVTWKPDVDELKKDVPCLQLIQCYIRDGYLEMFVLFRSEDVLSAFGPNAYALTALQKDIAYKLGVKIGKYTHYIVIAHLYHIRDQHELGKFIGDKQ
jgi:thymidylate synthase